MRRLLASLCLFYFFCGPFQTIAMIVRGDPDFVSRVGIAHIADNVIGPTLLSLAVLGAVYFWRRGELERIVSERGSMKRHSSR